MTTEAVSSQRYVPATVETGRIVNVNIRDWTVDVVSEHGDKKFFDIQVMAPYLHFANGEGMYCMPEVGALCWVCKPSDGSFGAAFILGFQAPHDETEDSFRNNRQSLNPGDMMMKTRDENFIILRRGGVVQVGSTPMAQRMYIPIGNAIRDFCENYELHTVAGDLTFLNARTEETTDGNVTTQMALGVREKARDPHPIANLTIGSHGEGDPTTLWLGITESGEDSAELKIELKMTKEGDVEWTIRNNFTMIVDGDHATTVGGSRSAEIAGDESVTVDGGITMEAGMDGMWKAGVNATMEAALNATVKAGALAIVEGATIHLGGSGAAHPLIKGDLLIALLTTLLTNLGALLDGTGVPVMVPGPSGPVPAAPVFTALAGQIPGLPSIKTFTS
jgi:hypothetical protein